MISSPDLVLAVRPRTAKTRSGDEISAAQKANYSAQNGSEFRFRDRCCFFFVVEVWKLLWSVLGCTI